MTHDPALVSDLARVAAAELDWDWQTNPTPVACLSPTVEAVLDRLAELGWRPPAPPSGIVLNIFPTPPPNLHTAPPPIAPWIPR